MASVTFAGNPVSLVGNQVSVGQSASDFTALDQSLQPVSLSDYDGKVRILSIFPSIDTGVCAMQAARFDKEASSLGNNVVILAISNDLPFAHKRYCSAQGLSNIITLSDHRDVDFGTKYGFLIKELRLLTRGIVVVDQQGVVKYVEYVPEITTHPDYESALRAAKALL